MTGVLKFISDATNWTRAAGHVRKADKLSKSNLQGVQRELRAALEVLPGYAPAANRLGKLLERDGLMHEAWEQIFDAHRCAPEDPRLARSMLRLAERAHRLDEGNQVISNMRGQVVKSIRLFRPAIRLLEVQCRFADAIQLVQAALPQIDEPVEALAIGLRVAKSSGDFGLAARLYDDADKSHLGEPLVVAEWCEYLLAVGRREEAADGAEQALRILSELDDSTRTTRISRLAKRLERLIDQTTTIAKTQQMFAKSSETPEGRGLVLVITFNSPYVTLLTALPALQLRERGFDVVYLTSEGWIDAGPTGNPQASELNGLICPGGKELKNEETREVGLRHDWEIDWQARQVTAEGVNLFQPLFESLCNRYRRYSIDIESELYRPAFEHELQKADAMLAVCRKVHGELTGPDYPVRILSGAPHLNPTAVPNTFCNAYGHERDMQCAGFIPGYEHYFSNLTNKRISAVSVANMTAHKDEMRMPICARREQFENWLDAHEIDEAKVTDRIGKILRFDRVRKEINSKEARDVMDRITESRARGTPLVVVFGKILYDICEPEQGGPAHTDIKDWINDTIRAAGKSEALFLIKPHPSETKKTFGTPTERFADLIEHELPENVILAKHRWFNIGDLLPVIDLGVVWAGTTALELGAAGRPCIVCNSWGLRDHPIDFTGPRDRAHYHELLQNPESVVWSEDARKRCIMLLEFLSRDEIMIPFPYAQIPLRGLDDAPKIWLDQHLERYFKEGDPAIDRITERILGG